MTHLANTIGIAMSTFAGAPDATGEGGVKNQTLNQIGNLVMLFVLFAACGWMWPTFRKILRYNTCHPNAEPARHLFWAGVAATPFGIARIGYNTVYAFVRRSALDPVMGSFAVKLVLVFGMWVGASVALCVGGWRGVPRSKAGDTVESSYLGGEREHDDMRGLTNVEMVVQGKRWGVDSSALSGRFTTQRGLRTL